MALISSRVGADFEAERIEGLALGVADGAAFGSWLGSRIGAPMPPNSRIHVEWIDAVLGIEAAGIGILSRCPSSRSDDDR